MNIARRLDRIERKMLLPRGRCFSVVREVGDDRPLADLVAERYDGATAADDALVIETAIVEPTKEREPLHG